MDIRKYQLNILCLLLFPLSAAGQEWNQQDSLKLQQMLESDQEININRKFIEKDGNGYLKLAFHTNGKNLPIIRNRKVLENKEAYFPFILVPLSYD